MKGEHIIEEYIFSNSKKSIHFISPFAEQQFCRIKSAKGYCIEFSEEYVYHHTENKNLLYRSPFFSYDLANPVIKYPAREFEILYELTALMYRVKNTEEEDKEKMLLSFLNILLLKCRSQKTECESKLNASDYTSLQLVHQYRKLIQKHYASEHYVRFYAEKLHQTGNYLNIVVKNVTGMTAGDLIHQQLINESKRMLIHTKLSSKEVAFELGFQGQSYFTKFFRQHTGVTPLAWFRAHK